jgi:hypothetical protein
MKKVSTAAALLPQNVQFREQKCDFGGQNLSKFPVIFPVSREFGRRKFSARLRPPPDVWNPHHRRKGQPPPMNG